MVRICVQSLGHGVLNMPHKKSTSLIQFGCGLMMLGLVVVPVVGIVLIMLVALVGG